MMKPIETIIFDMDGVIIDSEPMHMKIEQEIFSELGLSVSRDEHQQYVGTSASEMWEHVTQKYGLQIPAEEILEKKKRRYLDYLSSSDDLKPLEGVKELIIHLTDKGKQLILASSSSVSEIEQVLHALKLKSYFPHAVSGAELERSKPAPEIFLKAASLSHTQPRQCCVIEDSYNGVQAAKAAEMRCIGFRNPNSGNQDLSDADIIIDSFNDLNIDDILLDLTKIE